MSAPAGLELSAKFGEKFIPLFQPYRHKALYGGRGCGKSHAIATALVIMASQKKLRVVCARQFQNSIKDSSKSLIENKINDLGLRKKFWIGRTEIICKTTGSRFTFIGLERNPDSARSLEGCDICWVEEARNISAESIQVLIPTVRKRGSEIWWSWNPARRDDPIEQLFRSKVPPKRSYIQRVGIEDNPWFYDTEMPDEMARMQEANQDLYRHVWLGDYDDVGESRIFQNTRIGRLDIPDTVAPQFGLDFGFSKDPTALVKLYVLEDQAKIYISQEAVGRPPLKTMPAFLRKIPGSDTYSVVADSSRPDTIDYLNGEGFNVFPSRKGAGSVKTGIEWLYGYEIVIDPSCRHMEEEARLYCWQTDKISKKILYGHPCDDYNHLWDAVRYATEQNRSGDTVQVTKVKF